MSENQYHIEVKNLYKIFGGNPKQAMELKEEGVEPTKIFKDTGQNIAVNDVNFQIERGETFVVMGLSGSGKSTLIRCLNRLHEPTYGNVIIEGEDLVGMSSEKLRTVRRKKMGMVFQNFGLFPHRTVVQNVYYGLEIQGVSFEERKKRAYDVLDMVGLKGYEESMPNELSGGMQQRVGLARALVLDPAILLMDEAFSALDPLIRRDMQDELLDLQEKMQKTIVFITHDLDEALKLGDRIAVMYQGRIVQIGTPEEILTEPADDYVRNFVEDVDRSKVLRAEHIMKQPLAMVDSKDGPKAAIRKMRSEGISSIFVVNKKRQLQGILDINDAVDLADAGKRSVSSALRTDYHEISPDTLLIDLLPLARDAKYPIAVVSEDKRLLGVIVRVSVISGITRDYDNDQTSNGSSQNDRADSEEEVNE